MLILRLDNEHVSVANARYGLAALRYDLKKRVHLAGIRNNAIVLAWFSYRDD